MYLLYLFLCIFVNIKCALVIIEDVFVYFEDGLVIIAPVFHNFEYGLLKINAVLPLILTDTKKAGKTFVQFPPGV